MIAGAAVMLAGVLVWLLLSGRPFGGIGAGFVGGGFSISFGAWRGPLPAAVRRRIGVVTIAGLGLVVLVFLAAKLLAPRHSAFRVALEVAAFAMLLALLAATLWMARRNP